MKDNNPLIATVPLLYPAPPDILNILDKLPKLERGLLAGRLNALATGSNGNSVDFDWGICVGYADMLSLAAGRIDANQQRALAQHAKELRSTRIKTIELKVEIHPSGNHTLMLRTPGHGWEHIHDPKGLIANGDGAQFYRTTASFIATVAKDGNEVNFVDA